MSLLWGWSGEHPESFLQPCGWREEELGQPTHFPLLAGGCSMCEIGSQSSSSPVSMDSLSHTREAVAVFVLIMNDAG